MFSRSSADCALFHLQMYELVASPLQGYEDLKPNTLTSDETTFAKNHKKAFNDRFCVWDLFLVNKLLLDGVQKLLLAKLSTCTSQRAHYEMLNSLSRISVACKTYLTSYPRIIAWRNIYIWILKIHLCKNIHHWSPVRLMPSACCDMIQLVLSIVDYICFESGLK